MLGLFTSREQWHHPSASIKWLTLLFEHLINKMYQTDSDLHWLIYLFHLNSLHDELWPKTSKFFSFYLELHSRIWFGPVNSHFHFEDCIYSRLWKL
jgi:hypothetical protein